MKCTKCDAEIEDGGKVCSECGSEQDVEMLMAEADLEKVVEAEVIEREISDEEILDDKILEAPQAKKKAPKIIAAAAAIILVAAVGVICIFFKPEDPKTVVLEAFKSVYDNSEVYPIEEIFGFKELEKAMLDSPYEVGINMGLDSSIFGSELGTPEKVGMGIIVEHDPVQKKEAMDLNVEYNGLSMGGIRFYMDETNVMFGLSDLSDTVFSMNYKDDLQGQIERSPFAGPVLKESDIDLEDMLEYFDYMNTVSSDRKGDVFGFQELWERYKTGSKAIDNFKDAMVVEKVGKATFEMDGKETSCKKYQAAISKDSILEFITVTSKFMIEDETLKKNFTEYMKQVVRTSNSLYGYSMYEDGEVEELWQLAQNDTDEFVETLSHFLGDVTLDVYVDSKGRLAALDAVTVISVPDAEPGILKLHWELMGGSYLTQNTNMTWTLEAEGGILNLDIKKSGSYDEKNLISHVEATVGSSIEGSLGQVSYDGEYSLGSGDYELSLNLDIPDQGVMEILSSGVIGDVEKGKSFRVDMDSISMDVDGTALVELSGQYFMRPLASEITAPQGKQLDILAGTEEEYQKTIMEIYLGLMNLMESFE